MNLQELARDAFWGCRPMLSSYLMSAHGYEMDGVHRPANSCSLAEMTAWVAELDADQLDYLVSLDA